MMRKWIFLAALAILLISSIVFFISTRQNIDSNPSIAIIGGADGPTTIYIASPFTKMYFVLAALAFATADLFILAIIKIVEKTKNRKLKLRYKALILILFNLIAEITLLPSAFVSSAVSTIVIITVFTMKHFVDKRMKTPGA